jgi:hypothetical protein
MKHIVAGSLIACAYSVSALQLPGVANADGFRQPCSDIGRISNDAARNMLLVCDGPTHTWFMLPMMPRFGHHDAGTGCNPNGDEALSQDSNYLLTCVNGQWVNGTWR